MKIFIQKGATTYEAVPCGKLCSYAKKDGKDPTNGRWDATHCTQHCYCPKWWLDVNIDTFSGPTAEFGGLRRLPVKRKTPWTRR